MEDYKSLMDDIESISTSRSASQTQKVKASPTAAPDKGQNGGFGINPGAVPLLISPGGDGPSNPTARQPAQKRTIADEDARAQRSASKSLAPIKDVDAKRAITDSDPTELIELSVKHRKIVEQKDDDFQMMYDTLAGTLKIVKEEHDKKILLQDEQLLGLRVELDAAHRETAKKENERSWCQAKIHDMMQTFADRQTKMALRDENFKAMSDKLIMVAELLDEAQKENTTIKTGLQYHEKMTEQAQQNVADMDCEFRSNMQETFHAYKEIIDVLEKPSAANATEKERTSRLAAHISHLFRERGEGSIRL